MKYFGTVRWYNFEKGLGFAQGFVNGEEIDLILLHHKELIEGENSMLYAGDNIEFEINGRMEAKKIIIIND